MLSVLRYLNKYFLICFLYSCIFSSHYAFSGDGFEVLPNELIVKIATYLPVSDVVRLACTCIRLNDCLSLEAKLKKLKKLSREYYGSS